MNVVRIRQPNALRPLHVVVLCLLGMTVAGGSLLLSAPESTAPVDGAIDWQVESPLRAVVQLLCLGYQFPTIARGAVKIYLLGIGAGLALLVLSVAIAVRGRAGEEESTSGGAPTTPAGPLRPEPVVEKKHVAPVVAAQALVGLYLLWSFASSRWSSASELAIGGSILLTIHFLWALALGHGLSPAAARIASRMVVGVAAVTSLMAIWYYYGRNPTLRAQFPFGNFTFLAACLIPGILLSLTWGCGLFGQGGKIRRAPSPVAVIAAAAVLGMSLWAFVLADSRGPAVGLVFGLLAVIFFVVPRRAKLIPVLLAVGVAVLGALYLSGAKDAASSAGRGATLRFRLYSWRYAWEMYQEKPFTGHGQGGFVLAGDSFVTDDVLADPLVFGSRVAHAHNEWLEVMADLGSVGIVLLVLALWFTVRAGMLALRSSPSPGRRWTLVGLLGALVGLCVEACFGVGLRVSGVPTLFYTVIGLIWALSGPDTSPLVQCLAQTSGRRAVSGVIGGLLGLAVLVITQQDFQAARDGYRVEEHLEHGRYEEAAELAERAGSRINPQRALENLYRRGEAHALVAQGLQSRAFDRETRARASDLPDRRLLALAALDRQQSETRCRQGSQAIKELISRSPGYFNHGRIAYRLNLTEAANAHARGAFEQRDQFNKEAGAALLRELARQPFNPAITADYLVLHLAVAGPAFDLAEAMTLLARPLRHHRITAPFVELIARFSSLPEFDERFETMELQARGFLTSPPALDPKSEGSSSWYPEKLRLAGAMHFLRGEYQLAREVLDLAARSYGPLAASAPIGAASCYAELADALFFSNPNDPGAAIGSAAEAISLAPESWPGRTLKRGVRQRMIDYFLAADGEEEAKRLLAESGPARADAQMLAAELGVRYRRLCESLLRRREALVFRKSPADLLPKLTRWIQRSTELNPDDPGAHFVAADLAFHGGDCEATAAHLTRALATGLEQDAARQFLNVALDKRPDCEPLAAILEALNRGGSASDR